ncbi:MAG: 3-oxoacyl-[acyl-carrier-protein] reductase [Acidobacteria bacterium]|nr:3-oxoacyl-[acyl-carrier-protein] reductase [Acidobacteriota bacterium]
MMLTGRVALVTGASRGIGRAIALSLAAGGAHVVAATRGDNAAGTVDAIRSAGGMAELATLDVTDPASVQAVVADVLERHTKVDILVNNAGVTRDQLMLRMKRDDWDAVIAANLTGAYTCVQAVLKSMVRARQGRIISITSVVGEAGNAGQVNYAASKAGLIGFTKALALEVASRGITVNAVAPGLIETDMTKGMSEGAHDEWAKKIPLQRLGTPEDIAAAVRFLASDEAAYITGHVLAVNGGMHT